MHPVIDFKEHRKMRIRLFDNAFLKHEIIKLILIITISRKHNHWGVYSEYKLPNGEIPDVTADTGSGLILYEVQKVISDLWKEKIIKRDKDMTIKLIQPVDTVVIDLNKLSDNIYDLTKQIEEIIA